MKNLNLKRRYFKNLCSLLFSYSKKGYEISINRQLYTEITSIMLMFVQYFSMGFSVGNHLGNHFNRLRMKRLCSVTSSGGRSCLSLKNNCRVNSSSVAVRYFSSTSFPFSDKLIINSTYDNLVFDDGRCVLLMPSLMKKGEKMRNDGVVSLESIGEDSPFMDVLCNVVKNLHEGDYSFEFYFYIVGCDSSVSYGIVKDVYTFDPFDKNCLNKMNMCSYGFKKLVKISLKLIDGN